MRAARWFCFFFALAACGGRTVSDSLDEQGGGGGGGGRAAVKGGASNSGGSPSTPPESCREFCKELVEDCGAQLALGEVLCRSNCEIGFGGSESCNALRMAALACVQKALSAPMASCADFSRILTMDCLIPLTLSATCE